MLNRCFEHPDFQQGVPMAISAEPSFTLSKKTEGGVVPETICSFSSFTETGGDGDEDRAVAVVVEDAEEADEDTGSGRHSSQQQQQQSMKFRPSERLARRISMGVAAACANSRN